MLSAELEKPHSASHHPRCGGSGPPAKTVRTSTGSSRSRIAEQESAASSRCGETSSSGPDGIPAMSSEQPMLSVVIPVFDAAGVVSGQLEALAKQEWSRPWELVVADNGCTDGTIDVVERWRDRMPSLRIVDASDRRGPAHARNVGVGEARSEAVAFCDADDEVAPGWVAAMGEALSRHALVACRSDPTKLNERWVAETREAQPAGALSTVPFPPFAPYAGSGGLGVKKSLHERLGGFDESMPVLEDV